MCDLRQKLQSFASLEHKFNHEPDPLEHVPGLELLGNMPPNKKSVELEKSILGIGFETLDRDTFDPAELFDVLNGSGVKYARCQTGWMKCEKVVGEYDFNWLDSIADGLLERKIEPWFSLSFGHPVHTPSPLYEKMIAESRKNGTQLPGEPRGWVGETPYLHGPAAMEAWKKYVAAICRHFKGRVRIWEIWNEPEAATFWRCKGERSRLNHFERAAQFTEFARITADVIRTIIPDAKIITPVAQTGSDYIRGLGAAGLGDVIDAFSFHFYGPVPEEQLEARIAHIRAHIRRSDGKPLAILQGESGRATGKSAHFAFPSQLGQARYIARRYLIDFKNGMELSSLFTASDLLCYYPDGSDQYYGIFDQKNKTPKLGWATIRSMSWLFDGLELAPEFISVFRPLSRFMVGSWLPYQAVTVSMRRKGVPVFAVWVPEHVELSMPLTMGAFHCLTEEKSLMPDPVIIDPIRRKVWNASKIVKKQTYEMLGADIFSPFPVSNAPLIVTDASIFDELL